MVVVMNLQAREKLAEVLKELRGHEALTVFAKRFDVSYQALSKWESLQSFPDMFHLAKIAKFAGYSLDDFVCFLEGKQPEKRSEFGCLKQQVKSLKINEFVELYKMMSDRVVEMAIAESAGR